MAALVASLAILDVSLIQILAVSVPAFIVATLCTCLSVFWKGTELEKDPEFIRRVQSGQYQELVVAKDDKPFETTKGQKLSVGIFLLGVVTVIIFGTFKELLPSWEAAGKISTLPIPSLIQMIMLAFGLFIIVFCKVPSSKFASGSVFVSGLIGVWVCSVFLGLPARSLKLISRFLWIFSQTWLNLLRCSLVSCSFASPL